VFGGLAVVVVVAIVVALVAGGGDDDTTSNAAQETAAVDVEGATLPAFDGNGNADDAVGETLPTLVGENFDEDAVTVAPDGTPQILLVLIHSCPHCQAEVPRVVELADEGVFDGVTVTAIPTNTGEQYANYPPSSWLEREKWPFPVLLDDTKGTAAGALGTTTVPFFVFVDADGNVAGRASGEVDGADLTKIVDALKAGDELPLPGTDGGSTSTN
jgi:hypothetical protein